MNTYDHIIKKYNINVGRQHIVEIPNMGRNDMAKLFKELNFNLGAEVGVARGSYSKVLCEANPNLKLYGIDSWDRIAYESNIVPVDAGIQSTQEEFDGEYERAKRTLAPYDCTLIKKYSMDALDDFEDGSLDFVYIDANHDFPNFISDLHYWLKKVRIGGIISGHDYAYFRPRKHNHVRMALSAYIECYQMIPLFVFGTESKENKNNVCDRIRSWIWVKK